jgi:hypothetical protein
MTVAAPGAFLDGVAGTIAGRLVVALGGNALLRRGEPADASLQVRNVETAARALAELVTSRELVVTHGNGPQIGLLAPRARRWRLLGRTRSTCWAPRARE